MALFNDKPFVQDAYIFQTLTFSKMVLVLLKNLCDDLSIIDLIASAKVIRLMRRVVLAISDGRQKT